MKRFKGDDRGTAGFFEEMPVLLIVLIGLFLFLASFAHSYGAYLNNQETIKTHDLAQQFSEEIRGWDGLLDESEWTAGVFSYAKMTKASFDQTLVDEFNMSRLDFQYHVTIVDCSQYADKFETVNSGATVPNERIGFIYEYIPVVVVLSPTERHAAWLVVSIWGW
jgi:hypothetical protein